MGCVIALCVQEREQMSVSSFEIALIAYRIGGRAVGLRDVAHAVTWCCKLVDRLDRQ